MSKFSFKSTFDALVVVAKTLAHDPSNPSSEVKLERLTDAVSAAFEEVDNAVEFLPPGIRDLAAGVVDNPVVDGVQKGLSRPVARALAEVAYQVYGFAAGILEKLGLAPHDASAALDPSVPPAGLE